MVEHIPPHPGFGTRMENNYIFWDGNGIGMPHPKPTLLPFLRSPSLENQFFPIKGAFQTFNIT